jgi:hypothetical protein
MMTYDKFTDFLVPLQGIEMVISTFTGSFSFNKPSGWSLKCSLESQKYMISDLTSQMMSKMLKTVTANTKKRG